MAFSAAMCTTSSSALPALKLLSHPHSSPVSSLWISSPLPASSMRSVRSSAPQCRSVARFGFWELGTKQNIDNGRNCNDLYYPDYQLPSQALSSTTVTNADACSQASSTGSNRLLKNLSDFQDSCWRFLRPHTIRGTTLGSIALVVRALTENPGLIDWRLIFKASYGLIALICGNGYIVGINQIYDIGIDKVNKPYLPIAAGDLSVTSAWLLVLFFAATGLLIVVYNFGPFICFLYSLGLLLGTIYSVPPFRLKRYPVAAFLIIATVRGFLLNFGVYYATRVALGLPFRWSSPVAFITAFVTLFALAIAITKDLPDVEGDRQFQISTFATKLGVRNIALLGSGLLLANYAYAIFVALYMPQYFRRSIMVSAHSILALCLIFQAWVLEQAKYTKKAILQYYRFIWNLFYAEYLIFPVI